MSTINQPRWQPVAQQAEFNTADEDMSVIQRVHCLITEAIYQRASDIHFEPYENEFRIRYRLDGLLIQVASPPQALAGRIISRIKIMANLDISERRIPQDGRIRHNYSPQHSADLRVSTCPTIDGEKVVIRILDTAIDELVIDELGFNELQKNHFLHAISKSQGMILVTGPTGSGKSRTLYTALNQLNTPDKNISTAEEPVEIKVAGINQVNVNPKVGLSFATTLRAFLRQDPDIIMLGEIRDLETADIAIKAAQTGHLLLSTLHTNSAAETLTRLLNLGLSAVNIASSVSLIIAQRLVRQLCPHCKVASTTTLSFKACGCERCNQGYRGRIGLFEVMPISKTIRQQMMAGESSLQILQQAKDEGMISLYEAGLEKIKNGITTLEEVIRVTTVD